MNKRTLVYCFVVAVFLGSSAFGQIKKAQKQMDLFNYAKAVTLLQKELDHGDSQTKRDATNLIAECYRKMNDVQSAKAWYGRVVESGGTNAINYYYYAQAMLSCGEYEKAKKVFLKYDSLAPQDPKGKIYAGYCDSVPIWNGIPANYEVKDAQALNSKQSDFGPVFYEDGVVFATDRIPPKKEAKTYGWTGNSYIRLFYSKPAYPDDYYSEFSTPELAKGLFNKDYHDGPASFNETNDKVFINRTYIYKDKAKKDPDRKKTHLLKLFSSEKKGNGWKSLKPFFLNNNQYSVGHPALTPDGNTLYFVSDMNGGSGGTDIYESNFEDGKWSPPVNLGSTINTFGNEMFPFAADNGDLYFASDGLPGFGGLDLFVTRKVDGKWIQPQNLGLNINTSYDDFALAMYKETNSGLLSSNRTGGAGSDDIYSFRRTTPQQPKKVAEPPIAYVSGCVKDKTTLEPLPGSTVFILNEETNEVLVLKTNSTGCFRTKAIKGKPFIVKASKTSYIDDCLSYNFPVENKDTSLTLSRDLLLDKLEVNKTFKLDNIYYDFDKSFIRPDAEPPLNKLVSLMKEQPISVELGSHTDCRGSFPYNDRLSQRRAEAAVMYIIMQGISSSRIVAKGYGKHRLTNRCDCSKGVPCTEEEHQLNRRTEFKVTAINEDKNNGGFNPDRFKDGERLDARLLPFDFFNNCKDNEKKSSAVNVPSPNATENPLYTEVKAKAQKDLSQSVKMSEVNYASKSSSLPRANAPSQTFQTVGVTYTVQIAAGNAIRQDYLRNADHVMSCKGTDGITRYYVGKFTTKDEAVQYREQLRSKGYADAFLAKFDDNHRP